MDKLEKSIRRNMKFYGPALRAGNYWLPGMAGTLPKNFRGYLKSAFCDYDPERGIVTDIRLYTVGDGIDIRDYRGESIDITEQITEWMRDRDYISWNGMIENIADIVRRDMG